MHRHWLGCLILGLAAMPAMAQAPEPSIASQATEGVIVTAPKAPPEKIMHDFITSYTAPSPASGKVARWHAGICPGVVGLPESWNKSVTARIREVAAQAGAPVTEGKCRPNIDIVFTRNPQALLDQVRDAKPWLLGYHDVAQEKRLATVSHAVQAWYLTQTVDTGGDINLDDKQHSYGVTLGSMYFPNAHIEQWDGTHLADGKRSELMHVLVVVDLVKVNGVKLSGVVDDAAMLALAQTAAFEVCQPLASIANLTAPACDRALKTDALSASDMAYLHALYRIDLRDSLIQQQGALAYEMKKGFAAPQAGVN
ncbi:MAG TPA: hypothetical protein VFI23_07835 [Rhizomicrobium sp.]|nr:hypothetical protein [Rhizomicrobium sp.]